MTVPRLALQCGATIVRNNFNYQAIPDGITHRVQPMQIFPHREDYPDITPAMGNTK